MDDLLRVVSEEMHLNKDLKLRPAMSKAMFKKEGTGYFNSPEAEKCLLHLKDEKEPVALVF